MNLKTACYTAIILSIGSMFITCPGYLLFYYPVFRDALAMAVHLLLTDVVPYLMVTFISTVGYVLFLFALAFGAKTSRSSSLGLIAATVLIALGTFGNTARAVMHMINAFDQTPPLGLFVFAASGVVNFISELILCVFILMLLQKTPGAIRLAWTRLVFTILYSLMTIGSFVLSVLAFPTKTLYVVAYVIMYFGIFMAIAADLLVMTAYIGHARKIKQAESVAVSSIPCPAMSPLP